MADLSITAANVKKSSGASITDGIAGETITAGMPVYVNTNDSDKIYKADANGTSPAAVVAGIALNSAAADQPIRYATSDPALQFDASASAGCAAGDVLYLSATAGGITKTVGDLSGLTPDAAIVVLGVCLTANTMNFKPVVGGTVA